MTTEKTRWPAVMPRKEAAAYLGVSLTLFDELRALGKFCAVRFVKRHMYRRDDLDSYVLSLDEITSKSR